MTWLARLLHPAIAAAVCLVAVGSVDADEARQDKPAAIQPAQAAAPGSGETTATQSAPKPIEVPAAPERAARPAPSDPLEQELEGETARLQKMEAELKAVESLPLPSAEAPVVQAPAVKPVPNPNEIPKEPVKGLEEEYANALYSLGKYDLARAVYQRIIESKPQEDIVVWARFQAANCARHTGDLQAAGAGYETLMNVAPTSPWAAEAAWWAAEIKWWLLWNQSAR
jgi:TolA-binding protein